MGGNRTPVSSLEGPCSATELHPHGMGLFPGAEQVKPDFPAATLSMPKRCHPSGARPLAPSEAE